MDYSEALAASISIHDAKEEVLKHGLSWRDFLQDIGEKEEYVGEEVLNWLGY
jgi:hypothetical protein